MTTQGMAMSRNLLLNPEFSFLSFEASRHGASQTYRSGSIPFWDQDSYGDVEVYRGPACPVAAPLIPVDGVAVIHPGKSLRQFRLLAEIGIDPKNSISFSVRGYQPTGGALKASVRRMRIDHAPGEWCPGDFGQRDGFGAPDSRKFPRHGRGEMVGENIAEAFAEGSGDFCLTIPQTVIDSRCESAGPSSYPAEGVIGVEVVFTNASTQDVSVYAPCLQSAAEVGFNLVGTGLPDAYRQLPKTMSLLWRGAPLHVMVMGSSIDRGSANPSMYRYDEDPASPSFKEPLSKGDFLFDGSEIGHPEWTPYFGQWKHYFSCAGRLRRALMRRFDYPISKLLFNFMACDGSSIGECHSALESWSELRRAPDPESNGHRAGHTWQELYPDLMSRPGGHGPDLVLFGSGANEKIDGPDEIAAFEGAIRWFQRHYPDVEFLFCMWQHRESYTPNTGMLKELSLRYGIPLIDFGRTLNLASRHVDPAFLTPDGGHPQAAAHDLWARSVETAFQACDPIRAGQPQQYLPSPASRYTAGWEGEVRTYMADSPRIYRGRAFVLDDSVVSLWVASEADKVEIRVDGVGLREADPANGSRLRPFAERNPRNSTFVIGRLSLGGRHIVEACGEGASIAAADAKVFPGRSFTGVESGLWKLPRPSSRFLSEWGGPFGEFSVLVRAGEVARVSWVGTGCAVAWVARAKGGALRLLVDGVCRLVRPTDDTFLLATGERVFMENRGGFFELPFGVHLAEVWADGGDVELLGLYSYDLRPDQSRQRHLYGVSVPGSSATFTVPFRAAPAVLTANGLTAERVSADGILFATDGHPGIYHATGE